jgi:hypothetical protein
MQTRHAVQDPVIWQLLDVQVNPVGAEELSFLHPMPRTSSATSSMVFSSGF